MGRYRIYNIDYDTDGEDISLPKEIYVRVKLDPLYIEESEIKEELEGFLSDLITTITDFCHNGFDYELIKEE